MPIFWMKDWISRVTGGLGRECETSDWVERLLINETGELTATKDYVYRYKVAKTRQEQACDNTNKDSGGWSPELEQEFLNDEAAIQTVSQVLDDLEARGLIDRMEDEEISNMDRTYWRLTEKGEQEQDRLEQRYNTKLEQLQLEFGMTTQW